MFQHIPSPRHRGQQRNCHSRRGWPRGPLLLRWLNSVCPNADRDGAGDVVQFTWRHHPSRWTKRVRETDLTWNASAPESFVGPLAGEGARYTNQGQFAYPAFQSVTGTTIFGRNRPMAFSLR